MAAWKDGKGVVGAGPGREQAGLWRNVGAAFRKVGGTRRVNVRDPCFQRFSIS